MSALTLGVGSQLKLFAATFLVAVVLFLPARVLAGHPWSGGLAADCWQLNTYMLCRQNWAGANTVMKIRVVNELNNSSLWSYAQTAYSNWTVAAGPQDFQSYARSGDSYVYLKRDDGIIAPNGVTAQCNAGYCPYPMPTNIQWSEVYVPIGNLTQLAVCANLDTMNRAIFAHELGHVLGLGHHEVAAALMKTASCLQSPGSYELGDTPPCGGPALYGPGVRCIYNWNQ